jgi:hypothetical protein
LVEQGNLASIQSMFASADDEMKGTVLDALSGEPYANPAMGPGMIAMAVAGASNPLPLTRQKRS